MLRFPITITIDTNIFDSTQYDFSENSKLGILLKYVKVGKIKVVLSDIVLREVRAHAKEHGEDLFAKLNQNRTNIRKRLSDSILKAVDLDAYLDIPSEAELVKKMETTINSYMDELCSEVIGFEKIKLDEVIDDYFDYQFPFEKGKKRKEFPDAFIVNQIKNRFKEKDSVIILSSDEGVIKACKKTNNYIIHKSLDELFAQITAEEKRIIDIKELIIRLSNKINEALTKYIVDNEDIEVAGLSYDRKGGSYGHEYSETSLHKIQNVKHNLHIIDEIEDDYVIATLILHADVEMDCFYKDYDNAPYDSEIKDFIFIDTVHVRERHHTNHACRIKIGITDESVSVIPFCLHLGGDSRKEIIKIEDSIDYNKEYFLNENRKNLGFQALDKYHDFVEDALREDKINEEIPKMLNDYYSSCTALEYCASSCECFLEGLEKDINIDETLNTLKDKLDDYCFDYIELPDEYSREEVKEWLNQIIERCSIYEEISIPDLLELNSEYSIKGIDNTLVLGIDDIYTNNLSEGAKESADIYAEDDINDIVYGSIDLTVGYQHFDDDMCATDGEDEEVAIEYSEIKILIERFISDQEDKLKEFQSLEEVLNEFYEEE